MRRLTILFVNYSGSDKGGANRSLFDLLLGLKEQYGVLPVVLTPDKGWFTRKLERAKIPYECLPYERWLAEKPHLGLSHLREWISAAVRLKKKYHPDLVHTNTSVIYLGVILSKLMGIKHIWHIREVGELYYQWTYSLPKKIVKRIYQKSGTIIAISHFVKDKLYREYGIKKNIVTIYNGISQPETYQKVGNDYIQFAIIGDLHKSKRQFVAVKACRILWEKGITNFKLNLVGKNDTAEGKEIWRFVSKNHLENCVSMCGYCEDVNSFLKKMDIGIVASDFEAFGRTTIECMGNYMPVIGVDTGATDELVIEGYNGWKFHSQDEYSLAAAMEKAIFQCTDDIKMQARASAGKYSIEKHVTQIYTLYKQVLNMR